MPLALGLILIASTASGHAAEEGGSASPPPPAARQTAAIGSRPAPTPDPEHLRRRVEEVLSLDELLTVQPRTDAGLPLPFRCQELPPAAGDQAITPRRTSRPSFLDPRWLCWGACMLLCLDDGAPYDVCDEVCSDTCFRGSAALVAARAADAGRAEAELRSLAARGAEIVSPNELATSEPRRRFEAAATSYRCNQVACVCKGVRACLDLIDSGLCADFYCSMGPECACNRKRGS